MGREMWGEEGRGGGEERGEEARGGEARGGEARGGGERERREEARRGEGRGWEGAREVELAPGPCPLAPGSSIGLPLALALASRTWQGPLAPGLLPWPMAPGH